MVRKYAAMTLAVALASGMLAACGGEEGPATPEKPPIENKRTGEEPAELVIYGMSNTEEEFNRRWGDDLRQAFPQYTIRYMMNQKGQSLPELITAGQPIDIIFDSIGSAPASLIQNGFQYDITELAQKHDVDLSRFDPAFLDAIRELGGLYGLPVNGGGLVIYYNKDIFDKFGVPYPRDGMTWDELLELSRQVTRSEGGKQYAGFATSVSHMMRMNPLSLPIVNGQSEMAVIDNDGWKRLLQTMIIQPVVQERGYRDLIRERNGLLFTNEFVKDQSVAMFMMNFGLQYAVKEFETINWDMVSVPTFPERPGIGSQPYPNYFFITATSQNKDAAMQVLKYATSDEHVMKESQSGSIPVLRDEQIREAFGAETMFKDKNMKNAVFHNQFAPAYARTIYDDKVIGALSSGIMKVIAGESDLNTALRTAQEEGNKAIREMKVAQ